MKLRCDLHVNGEARKLVLVPTKEEKQEHLSLKLAAYVLFWGDDLTVTPSAGHPALMGQDQRPDLMGVDITGAVAFWVECGNTTMNKMDKVRRRFPDARVVVLKETADQAKRFRDELGGKVPAAKNVEVWYWPEQGFREWHGKLGEKTEIVGEVEGRGMNLVVNEDIYVADLGMV